MMNSWKNDVISISFDQLYKPRIGIAALLSMEFISILKKMNLGVKEEEIKKEIYDFCLNTNNFLAYKDEKVLVKSLIKKTLPFLCAGFNDRPINNFANMTQAPENYIINIKNLEFFLNKIWPFILKKIISKEITVYDYGQLSKTVGCNINISVAVILKNYPENSDPDEATSNFFSDLDKWLYYNLYTVKKLKVIEEGIYRLQI